MRAVNLIPSEQRGGASVGAGRSEGGAYAVIALLVGFAVIAFLYGKAHSSVSSDQGKASSISAQVQQTQAETAQLAPYTKFIQMREQRTQAVTALVDTRFDWAHVFHEFARVLPDGVSISSLTGTVGTAGSGSSSSSSSSSASAGASVASATPPGSVPTFSLGGCALTQQEVARMLTRLRLMDGVSQVTLQSSVKGAPGSGGGTAAASACPPNAPVFAAQITFDPLPTPPASAPGAKTVSDVAATGAASSTTAGASTP